MYFFILCSSRSDSGYKPATKWIFEFLGQNFKRLFPGNRIRKTGGKTKRICRENSQKGQRQKRKGVPFPFQSTPQPTTCTARRTAAWVARPSMLASTWRCLETMSPILEPARQPPASPPARTLLATLMAEHPRPLCFLRRLKSSGLAQIHRAGGFAGWVAGRPAAAAGSAAMPRCDTWFVPAFFVARVRLAPSGGHQA